MLASLLAIHVIDLDENVVRLVNIFADVTKIGGIVESKEWYQRIQHVD